MSYHGCQEDMAMPLLIEKKKTNAKVNFNLEIKLAHG
jgi:hypothetical protein